MYISELLVLHLRQLYLSQTMLFPLRFAAALAQCITLSFTLNVFGLLFGLWQLPVRARCWTSSGTWPSSTVRRLQILHDGYNLRLEPIAFDIYAEWLLTRRAQAHFAVSLNSC